MPISPVIPSSNTLQQSWNVEAPVFEMNHDSSVHSGKVASCEMSTQTEDMVNVTHTGAQTEKGNLMSVRSIGTQCGVNKKTKSIGVSCKMSTPTKNQYIQAIPKTVTEGTNFEVTTTDMGTQIDSPHIKIQTRDVETSCIQSPGAINRHMQTFTTLVNNVSTNTIKAVYKDMGSDSIPLDTILATESSGPSIFPSLEKREVEEGQCGGADPEEVPRDPNTSAYELDNLLKNLDVTGSTVGQFTECVNNRWRNRNMKGLLMVKTKDDKCDGEVSRMYWGIYDDFGLQFARFGQVHGFSVVQYVKFTGDYLKIMCMDDETSVFSMVDKNSKVFKKCENRGKFELEGILRKMWLKNPGGYGDGKSSIFGNRYSESGGYDSLRGHGGKQVQRGGYGVSGEYRVQDHCRGGYGGDR
jgi:hypothetical protein